jgi:hypothetical protein
MPPSGPSSSIAILLGLGLLGLRDPEDELNSILRNFRNYLPYGITHRNLIIEFSFPIKLQIDRWLFFRIF